MSRKDIFDKPFDEGTVTKLEIFNEYLKNWLPTFIKGAFSKPIQIFDLFAGCGYDIKGIPGSPIRTLETINAFQNTIRDSKKKIVIFINDLNHDKFTELCVNVDNKIKEYAIDDIVIVRSSNASFADCLVNYQKELQYGCNLIFIDQNGIKEVTETVFSNLLSLETTEFMFFISSTYLHRFANESEIIQHHPKFDFVKIRRTNRKKIHNVICEEFEKYVPKTIQNYALVPFSIMKNDKINVYGLIFVTKHVRGADKFIHAVWKENALNGNANYDIDDEALKNQEDFFEGLKLTKIEAFQKNIRENILSGKIKNNSDAYYYSLNQGHIPKHASDEIKKMKKEKILTYGSKLPLVNYDKVFKERIVLDYNVLRVK